VEVVAAAVLDSLLVDWMLVVVAGAADWVDACVEEV
jgi:hypothetical protein